MNIITSKAVQQFGLAMGGALIALVAVMFMPGMAHAQFDEGGDYGGYTGGDAFGGGYDSGSNYDYSGWYGTGGDYSGTCDSGCGTDSSATSNYDYSNWYGTGGDYSGTCGDCTTSASDSVYSSDASGCDASCSGSSSDCSSCGSSGSAYVPPSFGCSSCGGSAYIPPVFTAPSGCSSCTAYVPPTFYHQSPIYTTPANAAVRESVNACTATNSCNDNSNRSTNYTDNSVVATCTATNSCNTDSSYHYTDNSIFNAPTTVTTDSHNQQIDYAPAPSHRNRDTYDYQQPSCDNYNNHNGYNNYNYNGYNDYSYGSGYNNNCYHTYNAPITYPTYTQPVAYNTTPYVTLSQAPYTGLDLGPVGEVLYWAFLILWCLGAAYLIVVKRVQNKLVGFLNGFLFGSSTAAHTHKVAYAAPAAQASAKVESTDGIDPFIASQIKRA